jgi:AraC-like DNA-binding protein
VRLYYFIKFIKKQTYVRLLLLVIVASLCVTAAFCVFLSNRFSSYAIDEISKISQREIRHTVTDIDTLVGRLKNTAINMYADPDIHKWLSNGGADDPVAYVSATNKLTKFISTEAFIDNVYLFNMRERLIYETRYGLRSFETFADQEALAYFAESRPSLDFDCFEAGGRAYFAMKIPSTPARVAYNGYIVLTLNLQLFQERFLADGDAGGSVRALLLAGDWFPFDDGEDDGLLQLLAESRGAGADGSMELRFAGQKWLVHYGTVGSQGWTVFRLTHFNDINRQISQFRNILLISFLGLLCALLLLLYWYSRRTLRPLGRLADKVETLVGRELPPQAQGDPRALREYDVIERGIEFLDGRVRVLIDSMGARKDMIKEDYLKQWVLCGRMNPAAAEYLQAETDLLRKDRIYLAVLRIESYQQFSGKHDFVAARQVKRSIDAMAQEVLSETGRAAECVDMGADSVTVLIGDGSGDEAALKSALSTVAARAREILGSGLAVSMSLFRDRGGERKCSYASVYEMSMLKFIWGAEKIYCDSDFEEYARTASSVPNDDCLDEIVQELRLDNLDKALASFDLLIAQLRTMSYTNCKLCLTLYAYMIFKAFSRYASFSDFTGIQSRLESFDSVSAAAAWIKAEMGAISESIARSRRNGRQAEKALEIAEYVANNLHNPMLCVDDVAEHVSFSVRYVREIFKRTFDTSISDYILAKRLEKVCDLLKTTELPVSDIVEQTGFLSKSHFFTAFKRATGATPVQYRKNARGNGSGGADADGGGGGGGGDH